MAWHVGATAGQAMWMLIGQEQSELMRLCPVALWWQWGVLAAPAYPDMVPWCWPERRLWPSGLTHTSYWCDRAGVAPWHDCLSMGRAAWTAA